MNDRPSDLDLPQGKLLSIQVGKPEQRRTPQGRAWRSAIGKEPVTGRVQIAAEQVEGDQQASLKYHGGPNKAVCGYSIERLSEWKHLLHLDLPYGAFGENLSVAGLTEDVLCLGDVLAVGSVRLQVSQPRIPCVNVARRWNCKELPEQMMATGYTGFYCRVLQIGEIEAGEEIAVIERPLPEWTILRCNRALYDESTVREEVEALRSVALLTAEWKRALGRKLNKDQGSA